MGPQTKYSQLLIFVNKVLLEHSHAHLLCIVCGSGGRI